ncbi:hypothetical protein COY27_05160 [Candidatus Woesearchaeota archaeon CG_4_10_14_0_2_um_filter_33_13]|nr:MAG: hypothetical protein COY27_05160 [Candidatus Woesearchaeota archaeon CG_4_10_14_0_2_um_filter_33_13]
MEKLHLYLTLYQKPLSFWELLKVTDAYGSDLINLLNQELNSKRVLYKNYKFYLSEKTRKETKPFYHPDLKSEYDLYLKCVKQRPEVNELFWQDYLSPESVLTRVKFLISHADIQNKRVLILGDDDLLSIFLAATGLPKEVVVIEIDEAVLDYIDSVATKHKLKIKTISYNAAEPLPSNLIGKVDTFITEPVETIFGLKACLSRGAQSLVPNGSLYFGLSRIDSTLKKWYEIQKMLNQMNLCITDLVKGIGKYKDPKAEPEYYQHLFLSKKINFPLTTPTLDFYDSAFIRCKAVGKAKPLIKGSVKFNKSFYQDNSVMTMYLDKE